jgi:hypothetical protein
MSISGFVPTALHVALTPEKRTCVSVEFIGSPVLWLHIVPADEYVQTVMPDGKIAPGRPDGGKDFGYLWKHELSHSWVMRRLGAQYSEVLHWVSQGHKTDRQDRPDHNHRALMECEEWAVKTFHALLIAHDAGHPEMVAHPAYMDTWIPEASALIREVSAVLGRVSRP